MTQPQSLDVGFICEHCGVALEVYYTRKRERGKIERVRRCPSCGERVTTVEKKISEKISESSNTGTR